MPILPIPTIFIALVLQIPRKSDFLHHHQHPEGVVYRSFCLNSNTFAVSEIVSRRGWCIESLFPVTAFNTPAHSRPTQVFAHVTQHLRWRDIAHINRSSAAALVSYPSRDKPSVRGDHCIFTTIPHPHYHGPRTTYFLGRYI